MKDMLPVLFFTLTLVALFLNLLGLMNLIPLYVTLPLLFISIFLTLHSFTHRNAYRGMKGGVRARKSN
ncbi:hypothetical protein [Lentibacillus sediminis]|uniref:hypothetical protein n=1 Tax=Lentibacillus sediminis TaxID=1940529 RepID=UPI000C1C1473|nr:hypothetical protein [Lentibacillus sediminis]